MPTQKHPVFVLASQGVQLAQAVQESCPKSFDYLLEQPLEQLPDDRHCQAGAQTSNLDSNLKSAAAVLPDQQVVKVLLPSKTQHKLCGV